MELLLLSSSRAGDTGYLEHALPLIGSFLADSINEVLFIPYAGVTIHYDEYALQVRKALEPLKLKVTSLHETKDQQSAISSAQAILVGGGNTFALLNKLYQENLIGCIRDKVIQGAPYIGWSAGSNICGQSIKTTNDMPIIQPPSFDALNLIPLQINPHYIDGSPPGHHGETREQRLAEYLTINTSGVVIGLPEGCALNVTSDKVTYLGHQPGYWFDAENGKQPISPDSKLNLTLGH